MYVSSDYSWLFTTRGTEVKEVPLKVWLPAKVQNSLVFMKSSNKAIRLANGFGHVTNSEQCIIQVGINIKLFYKLWSLLVKFSYSLMLNYYRNRR